MKYIIASLIIAAGMAIAPAPVREVIIKEIKVEPIKTLTHRQEAWAGALEWCESRARNEAINPEDRDGTPSYYNFQFKPDTFQEYAEKYRILGPETREKTMENLKSYELQRKILENMIKDPDTDWEHQFPACVAKLGRPPKD